MNEIVNKILLAGDKFMPETHLKQPGFTYSTCGLFTKNKERIQKFKETGDASYIYKNELDKACFQHDMAYGDFKDLKRRTASNKILKDKAFNIAKDPKYDGYQRSTHANDKIKQNQCPLDLATHQFAEELQKPIIRKSKKRKVYSRFKDDIWGSDLADIQLISKFNKGFRFLLCVIDIFSKYAWVVPLKDKKGASIVNAFQKILDYSNRKPNKIRVDKGMNFTIIPLKNG